MPTYRVTITSITKVLKNYTKFIKICKSVLAGTMKVDCVTYSEKLEIVLAKV